jgi:hypothetical protein
MQFGLYEPEPRADPAVGPAVQKILQCSVKVKFSRYRPGQALGVPGS